MTCQNSYYNIVIGDFNGDGIADIYWDCYNSGAGYLWIGKGDGSFDQTAVTLLPSGAAKVMASSGPKTDGVQYGNIVVLAADLNGDGRTDLIAYDGNDLN